MRVLNLVSAAVVTALVAVIGWSMSYAGQQLHTAQKAEQNGVNAVQRADQVIEAKSKELNRIGELENTVGKEIPKIPPLEQQVKETTQKVDQVNSSVAVLKATPSITQS